MKSAWEALLGALLTVAACYASGIIVLAWSRAKLQKLERSALAFLTGAAFLHLASFAILAIHVAYKPVWWILLLAPIVWAWRIIAPRLEPTPSGGWPLRAWAAAIFVPFGAYYLVHAWAPEFSSDGSGYHLGIVSQYLRTRGFERIATNFYADLSQGVEMLYAPAFAIGKHSAAALVHLAFLAALSIAIYAYGRRIGKPWAGMTAAAIVFVSPIVGRDATTAYIDVATAAIAFGAFYCLELWDAQRDWRLLTIAGAMAGYAFDAKYTMFVMAVYAVVFVASRERRLRPVLIVAGAALAMMLPWLLKNWILVQDPLAPFATEIFPSRYLHTLEIEDWARWLRRYDMPDLTALPFEVTIRGQWTLGIIGPIFLLVPLALLSLRNRYGRRLLLVGTLLLATYFGNIGTRFLIPALPFFALALALTFERWKFALVSIVAVQAIASWPTVIPRYANPYVWRIEKFPYKAALRIIPEDTYLRQHFPGYAVARMLEDRVPANQPVFSLVSVPQSYTSREVIEQFPGALNSTLFDILNIARMPDWQPRRMLDFRFAEQRTAAIRIVQTAQGKELEQWNVHELRFYSKGVEVPRDQAWRIRAWPNPWEIPLAFDNSDVTRWRTWRTASPGMYIEVDFGREQIVDEVRMWTSKDYLWPIQFEIQSGGRKVADKFEDVPQVPAGFLGRAAMSEIYARGMRYLLVPDADRSAAELSAYPKDWGLEFVAHTEGTALYRIQP
jgi:hypothetical protein